MWEWKIMLFYVNSSLNKIVNNKNQTLSQMFGRMCNKNSKGLDV